MSAPCRAEPLCRATPPSLTRAVLACALLLCAALLPATAAAAGQAPRTAQPRVAPAAPKESPEQRIKRGAAELKQTAEMKVGSFAAYANGLLEDVTQARPLGWGLVGAAVLIGLISLMYGWTLVQSLLIPFAPVWGLMTGGVTAFCIIEAFYADWGTWFKLVLVTVGVALGLSLYLFAALRAKPVAAFLVVLSPFLILAVPLFGLPQAQVIGLILFCAGFLAGFAAMVEVRPLAILSTSVFGAGCFLAAWGMLAHLIGGRFPVLPDSFGWAISQPLMLVLIWAVVAFVGVTYQFSTGPRGTLAD
jgi:hypothetical protein